jgi:hypothetical protein
MHQLCNAASGPNWTRAAETGDINFDTFIPFVMYCQIYKASADLISCQLYPQIFEKANKKMRKTNNSCFLEMQEVLQENHPRLENRDDL